MTNRWERRLLAQDNTDIGRITFLRDRMAADLRAMTGRLEGVELAIKALQAADEVERDHRRDE